MPINIDACYEVIKNTKIRDLDYDWVAETALACRNEMEQSEDDDRIHDLLELVETLEDLEDEIEKLEDWEDIANNPDHPEHAEIMAGLGGKPIYLLHHWAMDIHDTTPCATPEAAKKYLLEVMYNKEFDTIEALENYWADEGDGSYEIETTFLVE